ncbi:YadA-like family protein [Fusobacterium nucleatum]|uniref:YadA-like family protein n=1 Tax=Fusobacterium nucleatum TaxID=851 RepID=UPI003CCAC405
MAFFLFLVLAQNSLAATHQDGTGSEAASDETVAVGLSYTDGKGVTHKNIAGNPAKPGEKYYATAIGIANTANKKFSSAFGYLNTATGESSSAFGYNNITYGKENSAFGYRNRTVEEGSSAFGYWNEARGDRSSAVGFINEASGSCSSAFGYNNTASGYSSSAFGRMNKAKEESSSAFGYLNEASGKWSNAFGSLYKVTGEASGAFGVGEVYDYVHYNHKYINEGKNSYMFGNYNKIAAGTQNNFILGNNVSIGSGINNSVALGNNSTVSSSNEVSVGSGTLKRKIVNVGDGEISNSSTDAVNGRQLYSGEGIDTAAWKAKLGVGSGGGGGGIDAYTKNEADNKFANKTDLNNYTKKDDYRDANGIDVDKWKAKLGTGASSTDIQNLRNEVYEKIDNVKNEVRNVGSLSAALAGLHPMQYDPKAPAQVMAALGHYKNKQAVAVGASYHFNDKFMVSTGVALSGEKRTETMANVGFTVKLGKGSGVSYNETPQYVVQNEVKRLTVENQDLKSKINNQDNRIKEQDEKIKNLEEKLNRLLKIK